MSDFERLEKFDYGLARWFALGYRQGFVEGFEQSPHRFGYPTDAEQVAFRRGYDAGVADYSQEHDSIPLSLS